MKRLKITVRVKQPDAPQKYTDPIDPSCLKEYPSIDFDKMYERAQEELSLQQNKRDQIITLYVAMFSFLIPFALSIEMISWRIKGVIFLAVAVIGVLFALAIIRYRVYKEAYWIGCQSITTIFGFRPESLNKNTVQKIYYHTLAKRASAYMVEKKDGSKRFGCAKYVRKSLFSAETTHFFIHAFITAAVTGLSVALMSGLPLWESVVLGIVVGVLTFLVLAAEYFRQCIKVYRVLIAKEEKKDKAFNFAFGKAWFLHFFLS